jgi:uncharacterized protein YbjT (DUF2867 family)
MDSHASRKVFVTGGTGYMGRALIPALIRRGHQVTAVAREQSRNKLPAGCEAITADVLDGASWEHAVQPAHTIVHLVGVAHPSPAKASEFVEIDQRSAREAIGVARRVGVEHFIYISVAHPAPAMHAYIAVRSSCETAIREAKLNATILRPWYVLGPGHWWPLALVPFYKIAELLPATKDGARRLGLLRLPEMIKALTWAVEHPPPGVTVLDVPAIREIAAAPRLDARR